MINSHTRFITENKTYQIKLLTGLSDVEQQKINLAYQVYAKHLKYHEIALKYLRGVRGLNDDIITRFELGFADKPLCKKFREVDEPIALRGLLQRTGLISPKGHQIFLGSVIIPIKQNGIIVGGVGRRISGVVRHTSTPYPFHLINEEALFNADCLADNPSCVILCKNPLEALSALNQGIEDVISLVANDDFTDVHAKQLKVYQVKVVKIAFNQSPDNLQKIKAIAQVLKRYRIRCKVIELPDWQDVNALTLYDPSGKQLKQRLRQAQPYGGH